MEFCFLCLSSFNFCYLKRIFLLPLDFSPVSPFLSFRYDRKCVFLYELTLLFFSLYLSISGIDSIFFFLERKIQFDLISFRVLFYCYLRLISLFSLLSLIIILTFCIYFALVLFIELVIRICVSVENTYI